MVPLAPARAREDARRVLAEGVDPVLEKTTSGRLRHQLLSGGDHGRGRTEDTAYVTGSNAPLTGEQQQTHQRSRDTVRRDLVTEHLHLWRQQSHAHDPHPRCGLVRNCASPTARPIRIPYRLDCWLPEWTGSRQAAILASP